MEVRLNAPVEEADEEGLRAGDDLLPARVRVWTAGIEIPDLVRDLPGARRERKGQGQARTSPWQTGETSTSSGTRGSTKIPATARCLPRPPSQQQGPWTARDLSRRLRGKEAPARRPPFRFFNRGYVVSLGPIAP